MSAIVPDRENQEAAIHGRTFHQQHGFGRAIAALKETSGVLQ
jgi:hypothetical protein